ncbi:MAG: His-Xaa-Ser system-associated MauG-like protein [Woeseia sp.]
MKYDIRAIRSVLIVIAGLFLASNGNAQTIASFIREAAVENGFLPAVDTHRQTNLQLAGLGQRFFESKFLSLNGNIACVDCHLDKLSSADGIANAIGVGGVSSGQDRVTAGGAIVPRNTLPMWGVGGIGYERFFWDGKVDGSSGNEIISQFGDEAPTTDALEVAVHLPVVEIREMLQEDIFVHSAKKESVESADRVYKAILDNLHVNEADAVEGLSNYLQIPLREITYQDVASAIAEFIRTKFALQETKFHNFVFNDGQLSDSEMLGARIFYGKGKCAVCHSGPYLTDFEFHTIAYPQRGFGKNGFGVDYGRFNVTHKPDDLYKFRTPPLFNIVATSPYGHSGSIDSIATAIVGHFDPLRIFNSAEATNFERAEYYKVMLAASEDLLKIAFLSDNEVESVIAFLGSLSFEPSFPSENEARRLNR